MIERKHIINAIAQFDDLCDDALPVSIKIKYKKKKYRVYLLNLLDDSLEVHLVDNDFDFGDGYYTFNSPKGGDEKIINVSLTSKIVEKLVHKIMNKYENAEFTWPNSVKEDFIHLIRELKREKIVRKKLKKRVRLYNAYYEAYQRNEFRNDEENEELKQGYKNNAKECQALLEKI